MRQRTQKSVSRRIDLNYFKHPSPLRTGRKIVGWLAMFAAAVWVGFMAFGPKPAGTTGGAGQNDGIHNPGPLTAAHALIQHDCLACHDGGKGMTAGDGKSFSKSISDAACLKCHDGAAHHPNQTAASLSSMKLPDGTMHSVTSNCASCHIEHRGIEVLSGKQDTNCTSCHADVAAHSAKPPAVQAKVVAFTAADHPKFGRSLPKDTAGKWLDTTVLKFNHLKHNGVNGLVNNCTACHAGLDPQPTAKAAAAGTLPPWRDPLDRPAAMADISDTRNLGQISFAKHCIGCHAIELQGKVKVTVPHEDLSIVRGTLAGLGQTYADALAAMPADARKKELETTVKVGTGPRAKTTTKILTDSQWVDARLAELTERADKAGGSASGPAKALYATIKKAATPASKPSADAPVLPSPSQLEFLVTYGIGSNCAFCHEVKGSPPAIAAAASSTTTPTMGDLATVADTAPTGIPTQSRHWFRAAEFSHYAHRSNSCYDCHSAAWDSKLTSDVLSPDMDTGKASCISCHRPETGESASQRFAPSNCTTCHGFHLKTEERPALAIDAAQIKLLEKPTAK